MANIERANSAYRQGVVLGLTMAEIMLLVVFILLLVSALLLDKERLQNEEFKKAKNEWIESGLSEPAMYQSLRSLTKLRVDAARNPDSNQIRDIPQILEVARIVASNPKLEEISADWQKLVPAKELLDQLREADQSVAEIIEKKPLLDKLLNGLRSKGVDIENPDKLEGIVDLLLAISADANFEGISADWEKLIPARKLIDLMNTKGESIDQMLEQREVLEKLLMTMAQKGYDKNDHTKIQKVIASQVSDRETYDKNPEGKFEYPPTIRLSEAEGYYFESGKAELTPKFRSYLISVVVPKLLSTFEKFPDVDIVEIIGHTDDQPIQGIVSNLDENLRPAVDEGAEISLLSSSDNAGLGLARAVSVTQVLLSDKRLRDTTILPLSAGHLTGLNEQLSDQNSRSGRAERRRIEIRVRPRSSKQAPG